MSFEYSTNEKVYCFHGPLIYEAKILKSEDRPDVAEGEEKGAHYFVHYKGWKQTWDEWVPSSRLLKFNEASHAKQKALIEAARSQRDLNNASTAATAAAAAAAGNGGGGGTGGVSSGSGNGGGGGNGLAGLGEGGSGRGAGGRAGGSKGAGAEKKKGQGAGVLGEGSRKRGREGDSEADYLKRPEVKIPIPDALKVQLVDDWENITKSHQLVSLPREPTVSTLISDYKLYATSKLPPPATSKRGEQPKALAILTEVLSGLQLYFDKSLGANLLYRFERQQYVEQRRQHQAKAGAANLVMGNGDEFEPSKVYGAEHLLRLFVNLPSFIAHTTMDAESVHILRDHIADFMAWMVQEQPRIFLKNYEPASAQYINVSRV